LVFYNSDCFKGVLYKVKAFYNQYPKVVEPLINP
jgi:hypothetical protein